MNKYIDSEKLIAEIERRRKQKIEANNKIAKGEIFTDTEDEFNSSLARYGNRLVYQELFEIICFIESLQQEQPEMDEDFFFDEVLKVYDDNNKYPPRSEEELTMLETIARHFWNKGYNARNEK